MTTVTISDARRFSLNGVQKNELVKTENLQVHLLCFEAGQKDGEIRSSGAFVYQVLEGEVIVHQGSEQLRMGKGKLLSVPRETAHRLENAGGGLLVVMATHTP